MPLSVVKVLTVFNGNFFNRLITVLAVITEVPFCILEIKTKPVSFEVFSDDLEEMIRQGEIIASWGHNVNVKIPITNPHGISTTSVVEYLSNIGVSVNVTALMTPKQVLEATEVINSNTPSYISVFAGRIADTGRDPIPMMQESLQIMKKNENLKLIWASPRELLNIFQASTIGCHIITATTDILNKIELIDKNLDVYSLDTVRMFYNDAQASGFKI